MQKQYTDKYLTKLRHNLVDTFNTEELKTLCSEISVDYDDLGNHGKHAIIRELVDYLRRRGELKNLINYCSKARPHINWGPFPEIDRLLVQDGISGLISWIQQNPDADNVLVDFIENVTKPYNIRLMALNAYIQSGLRNDEMFKKLLLDFDQNFRQFAILQIQEANIKIDADTLAQVIKDPLTIQDALLYTIRLAGDLIMNGDIPADILTLDRIVNYHYWLIRLKAITIIVDNNPPNALELLSKFITTTYWIARKRVYKFIENRYERGELTGKDHTLATKLLQSYINDNKSSEKETQKMEAVLEKIK